MSVSVHLSFCLSTHISQKLHEFHRILYTCELWLSLGPLLMSLLYMCTSGFVDYVIFSHSGPCDASIIFLSERIAS